MIEYNYDVVSCFGQMILSRFLKIYLIAPVDKFEVNLWPESHQDYVTVSVDRWKYQKKGFACFNRMSLYLSNLKQCSQAKQLQYQLGLSINEQQEQTPLLKTDFLRLTLRIAVE